MRSNTKKALLVIGLTVLATVALTGCQSTPEPNVSASVKFKCERYAKANVTEIIPQSPAEAVVAAFIERSERKKLKLQCMRGYL